MVQWAKAILKVKGELLKIRIEKVFLMFLSFIRDKNYGARIHKMKHGEHEAFVLNPL